MASSLFISTQPFEAFSQKGTDGQQYVYQNDGWNEAPTASQVMTVKSNNDWGVVSNQPGVPGNNQNHGYVQTYPCLTWAGSKSLSHYTQIRADHAETGPGYSDKFQWEAAFDIWLNAEAPGDSNGYEIMIWHDTSLPSYSSPGAYAHVIAEPVIDGVQYVVWQGAGGNGPATWFMRKTNAPATTTHILDILKWWKTIKGTNYTGPADPVLSTICYGWEVWGTSGKPANFHCSEFKLTLGTK